MECSAGHSHKSVKNIYVALLINLVFVGIELVGGIYAGSFAIIADALHDLGDSLTLFLAWILEKISTKQATKKFSYGYKRLSLLSSLFVSGILIIGSLLILFHSWQNINSVTLPNSKIMFGLALLGILFNGWAFLTLNKGTSLNEKAISLHMLEDLLGWVSILLGSILLMFFQWTWLDGAMAMAIAGFTLFNAVRNLFRAANLFLQAHPVNFDQAKYLSEIKKVQGITGVHDIHVWSLDGEQHIISYHIEISPELSPGAVASLKNTCRELLKPFGKFHCTIETEIEGAPCLDRCEPSNI
ncbi:MAG: cation diffusion facilitator family transporter [Pseudomonadota bacterium]|nr:cation diffusion facilitator family transporter [Pseudomonadota bacterium]